MTITLTLRGQDVTITGRYTPAQPDTRPTIDGPGEPGWPARFDVESAVGEDGAIELTAEEIERVIEACE